METSSDSYVTVLMVAEKPSIAKTLAAALGHGNSRERHGVAPRSPVHEFWGKFRGEQAFFKVTATSGHIYSFDFGEEYNDWAKHGPEELFSANIVRTFEGSTRLPEHLQAEARNCQCLVLWLDCDREGENICFEVMTNVIPHMDKSRTWKEAYRERIFRAKFSSLRPADLRDAMEKLGLPNENEALSVDARAEIDLRLGIAFSRFQTQFFKRHFGAQLGSMVKTVSYGPCQMPTLWFCVHRHCQIEHFQPKQYWKLCAQLKRQGDSFTAEAATGKFWDEQQALAALATVRGSSECKVSSMARRTVTKSRPLPLNTVAMLQKASERIGVSPGDAMHCAEQLYLKGILSYPRTETCKYPPGFDFDEILRLFEGTAAPWASAAERILRHQPRTAPRTDGADVGDHPPITPVRLATERECGDSGSWALYRLVCEHFLCTLAPDFLLDATEVHFDIKGTDFVAKSSRRKNFDFSWYDIANEKIQEDGDFDLSWIPNGSTCTVQELDLSDHFTKPPEHLSESDLLALMEKHGVGTDASMATHVSNVQKRGYVKLDDATRRLTPAPLGLALIHAYTLIDPALVRPTVRSAIENECGRIAKGLANKKQVVSKAIKVFEQKFGKFSKRVEKLPAMLAVAFSKERDGKSFSGQKEYTEQEWREYAKRKMQENPDMNFTEEHWLEWLKDKAAKEKAAQEGGKPPSHSVSQWDMAAKATASISLEELLKDQSNVELQEEGGGGNSSSSSVPGLRAGARVRIHGLKGAAELNGLEGVCERLDPGNGRWHTRIESKGETKALKAENLELLTTSGGKFKSGMCVVVHSLKGAAHLNGQEGICEHWDPAKGRWNVRLPLGEVKALKPENLEEEVTDEDKAKKAIVSVQKELELLGFGSGFSSAAPRPRDNNNNNTNNNNNSNWGGGDDGKWSDWRSKRQWGDQDYYRNKQEERRDRSSSWSQQPQQQQQQQQSNQQQPQPMDADGDWKRPRRGRSESERGGRSESGGPSREQSDDNRRNWNDGGGGGGSWRDDRSRSRTKTWDNSGGGGWKNNTSGGAGGGAGGSSSSSYQANYDKNDNNWIGDWRKSRWEQGRASTQQNANQSKWDSEQDDIDLSSGNVPTPQRVPPRMVPPAVPPPPSQGGPPPPPPAFDNAQAAATKSKWDVPPQQFTQGQQGQQSAPPPPPPHGNTGYPGQQQPPPPPQQPGAQARPPPGPPPDWPQQQQQPQQTQQAQGFQQQQQQQQEQQHQSTPQQQQGWPNQHFQFNQWNPQSQTGNSFQQQQQYLLQQQQQQMLQQMHLMQQRQQQQQQSPPPPPPQQQQQQQQPRPPQQQQQWQQQQQQRPPSISAFVPAPPSFEGSTGGSVDPYREDLKRRVFAGCDKNQDGFLDCEEMMIFAVLTGFEGSDESWALEYERLCQECRVDLRPGIDIKILMTLVEDKSPFGFYCSNDQLEDFVKVLAEM